MQSLEYVFMEIVLICLALGVVVAGIIAFFGRCKVCCSMNHAFSQDHAADLSEGRAYIVCKRCGDRQYKGDVSSDGSVIWMSGVRLIGLGECLVSSTRVRSGVSLTASLT